MPTSASVALLEICNAFHPYLMKYLVMIRTGHVAMWAYTINKGVTDFIRYFVPKGEQLEFVSASARRPGICIWPLRE